MSLVRVAGAARARGSRPTPAPAAGRRARSSVSARMGTRRPVRRDDARREAALREDDRRAARRAAHGGDGRGGDGLLGRDERAASRGARRATARLGAGASRSRVMMRRIASTASRGYSPAAVSAESITASVPSRIALATSLASARVGRGCSIIDSSICVAVITGRPMRLRERDDLLLRDRHFLERQLDAEVAARDHHRVGRAQDLLDVLERRVLLDLGDDEHPLRDQRAQLGRCPRRAARSSARGTRARCSHGERDVGAVLLGDATARDTATPGRFIPLWLDSCRRAPRAACTRRPSTSSTTSSMRPSLTRMRSPACTSSASIVVGDRAARRRVVHCRSGTSTTSSPIVSSTRRRQVADADARPLQVAEDRDGTSELLRRPRAPCAMRCARAARACRARS